LRKLEPTQAMLSAVSTIPRDAGGPVFREPWESQAFALALALHERGLFSWSEWSEALAEEIRAAQGTGDPDAGDTYYRHWLAALERIVIAKGLAERTQLAERCAAWGRAARATPHGQPIVLANDPEFPPRGPPAPERPTR
jgi:nitrile hydratase accessory protein